MSAPFDETRLGLPEEIENAIDLFRRAPVGLQLADPSETNGRCGRAAGRFISALRESGSDGTLLEWGELENAWHQAVLLPDGETVIDWTAAQFELDDEAAANCPYPRVESLAIATNRWGNPARVDPDVKQHRWLHDIPELMTWDDAQKRIPDRGSEAEKAIRG